METGIKRCTEIFGAPPMLSKENEIRWNNYDRQLENVKGSDGDWENSPLAKQLFTYYYSGCGGTGWFVLKHVAFDTAFVGWDLD
jgi:hypothetical protein